MGRGAMEVPMQNGVGSPAVSMQTTPLRSWNINSETKVFVWEGGAEIDNIVNKLTHVTRLHKHLSLDDYRHLPSKLQLA